MTRSARLALVSSLAIASSRLSSPESSALAFAPPAAIWFATKTASTARASSKLFYQAGTEDLVAVASAQDSAAAETTVAHINDSNYQALLNNPLNRPVLVDCYVSKCGPCKLIEGSIDSIRPKYANDVAFCKWDADTKDESQNFMNLIRERRMTFRKLPTLVLFVGGEPVAIRSGMASAGQIDSFLEEHLPVGMSQGDEEECVDEVNFAGERILCNE